MPRASRSSSRAQDAESSSPQPPPSRSRKRVAKDDSEEDNEREEAEQSALEEPAQPRRRKHSRASEDGPGGSGGSSISGGGGGGGAGSGSGSGSGSGRRSSGFQNIASQDNEADEEDGEDLSFNESQDAARAKMVKTAKRSSKEVEIQEKDLKKASELTAEEIQEVVKKMVRFLLMKGLNHEPVTKKDMMDLVLGDNYRGKGVLKYVLTKADEHLRDGVGFRVKNVVPGNDWFVKDTYYVINVLNNAQHSKEILKKGRAGRGLLMLILSFIHCSSDKVVGEDQLFKKLHDHVDKRIPEKPWQHNNSRTKIKVHVDGLGELHDHLATFVKQHYLMKKTLTKPTADGGSETFPAYAMGARSVLEIGSVQLVQLMAQVLGTTVDPSEMVDLEGESQGLSQMATQDN